MKFNKMDLTTEVSATKNRSILHANQTTVNTTYVSSLEKWFIRRLIKTMGNPEVLFVLPDQSTIFNTAHEPKTGIHILSRRAFWRFLINPQLYFGEEYSAGEILVLGDLTELLQQVIRARPKLHEMNRIKQTLLQALARRQNNTLSRARKNIQHHYDVGNDFYKLWLDQDLVYTCAYYPDITASLEQAQFAKMDYICRKLRLQPGETVVEAGCGWGTLARHMAKYYGVNVKAYNISHQQIVEARERAKADNLDHQIEYIEDDYRNITGTYDVFVSVGMLEHVGVRNYRQLGSVIDHCLKDQGRGLIHSIAQPQSMPMNPWLVKRIFPGGYSPTLREMMDVFEPRGFSIMDVENLRLHYARTLQHWLERFEQHTDQIKNMYDESFVRSWRLYLCGAIANFLCGDLDLFQVSFARPKYSNMPMNRAYLYQDEPNLNRDNKAWKRVTS